MSAALGSITGRVLVMGIDSDILYPIHEQKEMIQYIPHCDFSTIISTEGHDGFLLEQQQLGTRVKAFLDSVNEMR